VTNERNLGQGGTRHNKVLTYRAYGKGEDRKISSLLEESKEKPGTSFPRLIRLVRDQAEMLRNRFYSERESQGKEK